MSHEVLVGLHCRDLAKLSMGTAITSHTPGQGITLSVVSVFYSPVVRDLDLLSCLLSPPVLVV